MPVKSPLLSWRSVGRYSQTENDTQSMEEQRKEGER